MALGTVLTLQQRYDEALGVYKRGVKCVLKIGQAWGNLANAQEFTGRDSDEAARDYRKAIELATLQLKTTPDPFWFRGWESFTPA